MWLENQLIKNWKKILFHDLIYILLKIEKYKGVNSKDFDKELLSDFFANIIEKIIPRFIKNTLIIKIYLLFSLFIKRI